MTKTIRNYRFKPNWRNQLILEVEVLGEGYGAIYSWRVATVQELMELINRNIFVPIG